MSLCVLLAVAAAVVFFAIAVNGGIYAPGAGRGHLHAGLGIYRELPPNLQYDLSNQRVLRKIYSVGAFAIVGLLAASLAPRAHRALWCAALLAAYSLTIEIAQKVVFHSPEGLLSNAFDVGCGALGGWLGALVFNGLTRRANRGTRPR